jgi:hypothetical protein
MNRGDAIRSLADLAEALGALRDLVDATSGLVPLRRRWPPLTPSREGAQ